MLLFKKENEGQNIPAGHSNSLIENKLTTPWLKKKKKDKQTNNSTQDTT